MAPWFGGGKTGSGERERRANVDGERGCGKYRDLAPTTTFTEICWTCTQLQEKEPNYMKPNPQGALCPRLEVPVCAAFGANIRCDVPGMRLAVPACSLEGTSLVLETQDMYGVTSILIPGIRYMYWVPVAKELATQ